ncbi:MAG: OsmC family protein [Gemmatimonadales bacterium]|nr:OsmC family protein [Gemmatimonadales bacterium]
MISETLTFPGASGDQLVARLERPDDGHWSTALFAHCFTCSKDLKAVRRISRALVDEGVAVFTFDFTGLGESEGDFADTNFSSNLDDLEAACRHLEALLEAPSLLLGHSLGGAAVLAVAERMPVVKAVATIGAPSDLAHLAGTLERAAPELAAEAEAQVSLGGRPFRIRQQLLEDLRGQRLREVIARLSRPLLIFHSPIDDVVAIDHARKIYDAAKHPKSFLSLDGADHLLLQNPEDAAFIGRTLAAWMTRYIRPPDVVRPPAPLPHGEVLVESGPSGFANTVWAGGHRLLADEPVNLGGTDTGPNPYEYLLGALGACTAMTLRMYADRKGWPLGSVRVRLSHAKIHAKDCGDCETKEGRVDRITRDIEVAGPLDDAQRARLLEIADRCPVHRTMHSEVKVESTLVPDSPSHDSPEG